MKITRRRSLGVVIGLAVFGVCAWANRSWADPPSAASQRREPTGALAVVVSTSADPASSAFFRSLRSHPWFAANAGRVRLVEAPAGPKSAEQTGAVHDGMVTVLRQGAGGYKLVGRRSAFAGANEVVRWVSSLDATVEAAPAPDDPGLVRTGFDGSYPSSQQAAPPVVAVPSAPAQATLMAQPAPIQTIAVPQPVMVPQQTTMFAPASAPANVIQAPAQNYVIQQPPAQFFFAQQASAAPAAAPAQVMMASAVPASAAPANLFMPASAAPTTVAPAPAAPANVMMVAAPASAPPSMPMMAVATAAPANVVPAAVAPATPMMMAVAAPPAPAAVAGVPAAVGPVVSGAAVSSQSVSIPASSTRSRVRVRGPGPMAAMAARLGERLTRLGRTRIETIQETSLETPIAAAPPGQLLTLTSTSASPVMAPQQSVAIPASLPPQQTAPPPCAPPAGPSPQGGQPSPQGTTKHH